MENIIRRNFEDIYARDHWRAGSGTGSRPENNIQYIAFLSNFIRLNSIKSVFDIGCGDWQFSRFINWDGIDYIGYDIVPSIVERNRLAYNKSNIRFEVYDDSISLPVADLYLCKDVLQHLPNKFVDELLKKIISSSKWSLITNDDYPSTDLNSDIIAGGWRAIRIDQNPFNYFSSAILEWTVISETPLVRKRTELLVGKVKNRTILRGNSKLKVAGERLPMNVLQTWKSKLLPDNFKVWSASITERNPGFSRTLTDDNENREFILTFFPWFLEKYDSYEKTIMRVDAFRYFWLYKNGGFYMDLDVECLRSLSNYDDVGDIIFCQMGADPEFHDAISNAIMASRPRQDFWLYLMSHLVEASSIGAPEISTGPSFLTFCINMWERSDSLAIQDRVERIRNLLIPELKDAFITQFVRILPPRTWFPLDWSDPLHQLLRKKIIGGSLLTENEKLELFPKSDLVTYWTHTW